MVRIKSGFIIRAVARVAVLRQARERSGTVAVETAGFAVTASQREEAVVDVLASPVDRPGIVTGRTVFRKFIHRMIRCRSGVVIL